MALPQKKCSVIFNNKFGKFLIQRFCNGKEIAKVQEIDELEVTRLLQNKKEPIVGFQFQEACRTFNLFEKVDILDIEKKTAWAIKNEGSSPTRANPFYFVPPRVSIPKAK